MVTRYVNLVSIALFFILGTRVDATCFTEFIRTKGVYAGCKVVHLERISHDGEISERVEKFISKEDITKLAVKRFASTNSSMNLERSFV